MSSAPSFTIGIEEEYLLLDAETLDLAGRPPKGFMERCRDELGEQVTHEFLQSQVEIGTSVCRTVDEARAELARLRRAVATCAEEFGMRMIVASTHPWASWRTQAPVDLDRYRILGEEHQSLARRMVICGMHVHAGIEDRNLRIDLMNQVSYFLPHLLALSGSSPFWEGQNTGLKSFRPIIIGDLPRSGLPEQFDSWSDWTELLDDLRETGLVDDPSKIWWDMRPSGKHPTLEMRVTDNCTKLDDACCVAALYQSLLKFLYRLRSDNQTWRRYRRILVAENKWRAQRWGTEAKLADYGRRRLTPLADLVEELITLVGPHAEELGCLSHVERARDIVREGASADHQLRVYEAALGEGAAEEAAQKRVVEWLVEASLEGV